MFDLPYVYSAEELIDIAFRKGSKESRKVKSTRRKRNIRLQKSEEKRIIVVSGRIESCLSKIIKNFPSYDQLPPFYQRLLDVRIDKNRYKKSLGAVQWCVKNIKSLRDGALRRIRTERDTTYAKQFLGRTASIVKQISRELDDLIEIKKSLESFPDLEDAPTLVVAGYPNVGKSTFVRNLTGSDIKVADYPFTTQIILIGRKKVKYTWYQIIDSPGLLDRPMESRNPIELQAILALEFLADVIFFMIDPTSEVEHQLTLLDEISEKFRDVGIVVGLNKADVASEDALKDIEGRLRSFKVLRLSSLDTGDCERVFNEMLVLFKPRVR